MSSGTMREVENACDILNLVQHESPSNERTIAGGHGLQIGCYDILGLIVRAQGRVPGRLKK